MVIAEMLENMTHGLKMILAGLFIIIAAPFAALQDWLWPE